MTERKFCGATKADGSICKGLATSTGFCRPHSPKKEQDPVKEARARLVTWVRGTLVPEARDLQRNVKVLLKEGSPYRPGTAPGYSDREWQEEFPTGQHVAEDLLMLAEDFEYCCRSWLERLEGKS